MSGGGGMHAKQCCWETIASTRPVDLESCPLWMSCPLLISSPLDILLILSTRTFLLRALTYSGGSEAHTPAEGVSR